MATDPRVPGAEPLSPEQIARLIADADTQRLLVLGTPVLVVAALRELQALRAERIAALASGEVQALRDRFKTWAKTTEYARNTTRPMDAGEQMAQRDAHALLVDALAALASSLTPQQDVEALAKDWIEQAERMRLRKGQMTREKAGYEILADCGYALRDALARVPPAPQPVAEPIAVSTQIPLSAVMTALSAVPIDDQCDEPVKPEAGPMRDMENASGVQALGSSGLVTSPAPAAQAHIVDNGRITQIVREPAAAQARNAGRVDLERIAHQEAFGADWPSDEHELKAIILAALQRARETDGAKR